MVVYLGALGNHFAQDDNQIIAFNALVHHVSGLWRAFAAPYWPADVGGGLYRPLAIASYALDWSLSGGAVTGFAVNTPADLEFSTHADKVQLRVHHSLYYDETAALSHWHIPETYYLEGWGDARAYDGTASIIQPLINPLYQSKCSCELLSALLGDPTRSSYEIVQGYWKKQHAGADFDDFWTESVRKGVIPNSQVATLTTPALRATPPLQGGESVSSIELNFRPDPSMGITDHNDQAAHLRSDILQVLWSIHPDGGSARFPWPFRERVAARLYQMSGRSGSISDATA